MVKAKWLFTSSWFKPLLHPLVNSPQRWSLVQAGSLMSVPSEDDTVTSDAVQQTEHLGTGNG